MMETICYRTAGCLLKTGEALSWVPDRLLPFVREENCPTDTQPRLLDRLRLALRSRHYSRRTEKSYVMWVRRFIFFHNLRHPAEMAEPEINSFLTTGRSVR